MRFLSIIALLVCASAAPAAGLSAQQSAELQASNGRCAHMGGSFRYEGVGFSSSSAQAAIRNCCYYGQRTPVEIGVARGARGWYACVRYN